MNQSTTVANDMKFAFRKKTTILMLFQKIIYADEKVLEILDKIQIR
jgi:hypothetical protein